LERGVISIGRVLENEKKGEVFCFYFYDRPLRESKNLYDMIFKDLKLMNP
jgi:hypothetical protein